MKEIIIFVPDFKEENKISRFNNIIEWIEKNYREVELVKFQHVDMDRHKEFKNKPSILIFDEEYLEDVEYILGEREFPLVIFSKDLKSINQFKNFPHVNQSIFGLLSSTQEDFINFSVLRSYHLQVLGRSNRDVLSISANVDEIWTKTMNELAIVKKLHRDLVPLREYRAEGFYSTCKINSGLNSGGEFFDSKIDGAFQWCIFVKTNSYIVSSLAIGEVEGLKSEKDLIKKIPIFFKELKNMQEKYHSPIEALVMRIGIKAKVLDVWGESESLFFINHKKYNLENSSKLNSTKYSVNSIRLEGSGQIIFLSSGLKKMFDEKNKGHKIEELLKLNRSLDEKDTINELMMDLKTHYDSQFLPSDAVVFVANFKTIPT